MGVNQVIIGYLDVFVEVGLKIRLVSGIVRIWIGRHAWPNNRTNVQEQKECVRVDTQK